MALKFENLTIWKKSLDLGFEIHELTRSFPKEEMYILTSQIKRAADSVTLNIAEGSIGQSNPEFQRFMGFAVRSLAEVVTCLYKASKRNYISEVEFNKHYKDAFNLMNMMVAFKKKIA